eukprot:1139398-Pelagomonas_calceolata.AAC.4
MRSIGGLAGSRWAGTPEGLGGPLSPHLWPAKSRTDKVNGGIRGWETKGHARHARCFETYAIC